MVTSFVSAGYSQVNAVGCLPLQTIMCHQSTSTVHQILPWLVLIVGFALDSMMWVYGLHLPTRYMPSIWCQAGSYATSTCWVMMHILYLLCNAFSSEAVSHLFTALHPLQTARIVYAGRMQKSGQPGCSRSCRRRRQRSNSWRLTRKRPFMPGATSLQARCCS